MRGKVARDLRRLAFGRWTRLSDEGKKSIPIEVIYKEIKKEYKRR